MNAGEGNSVNNLAAVIAKEEAAFPTGVLVDTHSVLKPAGGGDGYFRRSWALS